MRVSDVEINEHPQQFKDEFSCESQVYCFRFMANLLCRSYVYQYLPSCGSSEHKCKIPELGKCRLRRPKPCLVFVSGMG